MIGYGKNQKCQILQCNLQFISLSWAPENLLQCELHRLMHFRRPTEANRLQNAWGNEIFKRLQLYLVGIQSLQIQRPRVKM